MSGASSFSEPIDRSARCNLTKESDSEIGLVSPITGGAAILHAGQNGLLTCITAPKTPVRRAVREDRFVTEQAEQVRDALIRQWQSIAEAVPRIDLTGASRVAGWTNRQLLAHLTLQPHLVRHFLKSSSADDPSVTLTANLRGTRDLADTIDEAARKGAEEGKVDFASAVERALPDLMAVDLTVTVVTLQGPISLGDYLVTRCVEAVVHGYDFLPPVSADAEAEAIAAQALVAVLADTNPKLVAAARALPPNVWLDVATGRQQPPAPLAEVCPLMT